MTHNGLKWFQRAKMTQNDPKVIRNINGTMGGHRLAAPAARTSCLQLQGLGAAPSKGSRAGRGLPGGGRSGRGPLRTRNWHALGRRAEALD